MLVLLRAWVGLLGIFAVASGIQCFLDEEYPFRRIYTLTEPDGATPLTSRMFGVWTILAGVMRLAFVASPGNRSVYTAVLLSFLLAFAHFFSEVFLYGTADLVVGTIIPLTVSGLTVVWMVLWLPWLLTDGRQSAKKKT